MMALRRFGLLVVLALLVGMSGAVLAQEGLSEDQDALLERVFAARALRDGYGSFVTIGSQTETQSVTIKLGEASQSITEVRNLARTVTFVQGNVSALLDAGVEKTTVQPNGREVVSTYTVSGEARLVDDVFYLNATLGEGDGPEVPELPDGWFEVENPDDYPFFYLDDLRDTPSVLDDEDQARLSAADVTVEHVTLEDGAAADQITVIFGKYALALFMNTTEEEIDPLTRALLDAITENFEGRISVTLDADNNPLHVETSMTLSALGIDAHALAPDQFPEGVTLDFHFERSEMEDYSDVNAAFEAVGVPE